MSRRRPPSSSRTRPTAHLRLWLTLLVALGLTTLTPPVQAAPALPAAAPPPTATALARRPALAFVANRGQSDSAVHFLLR